MKLADWVRFNLCLAVALILGACHHKPVIVDNCTPEWYKTAVIYNLDVKTFKDGDGDGIGDFRGLTQKPGYLDSLGVNTIWLAPFQPSRWQAPCK